MRLDRIAVMFSLVLASCAETDTVVCTLLEEGGIPARTRACDAPRAYPPQNSQAMWCSHPHGYRPQATNTCASR